MINKIIEINQKAILQIKDCGRIDMIDIMCGMFPYIGSIFISVVLLIVCIDDEPSIIRTFNIAIASILLTLVVICGVIDLLRIIGENI